jgi:hypothetical protein
MYLVNGYYVSKKEINIKYGSDFVEEKSYQPY